MKSLTLSTCIFALLVLSGCNSNTAKTAETPNVMTPKRVPVQMGTVDAPITQRKKFLTVNTPNGPKHFDVSSQATLVPVASYKKRSRHTKATLNYGEILVIRRGSAEHCYTNTSFEQTPIRPAKCS